MNRKLETLGQDQPSYLGEEGDIIITWQFKMKWDHEQNYILKQKCGFLTVSEATFLLCHIASVMYLQWLWVPLRGREDLHFLSLLLEDWPMLSWRVTVRGQGE